LSESLDLITKFDQVINEGKLKIGYADRLIQIVDTLGGPNKCPQLIQPDRSLLLEGHMRVIFPGRQNVVHCYIFLYNDAILITKRTNDIPFAFKELKWSDFTFEKPGNFLFREIKKIEGSKIQLIQLKNTTGFEVLFSYTENVLYRFFPWNNSGYGTEDWINFFSKAVEELEIRRIKKIERQNYLEKKIRETMFFSQSVQSTIKYIAESLRQKEIKNKKKSVERDISKLFSNFNLDDINVKLSLLSHLSKLLLPDPRNQSIIQEKQSNTTDKSNTPKQNKTQEPITPQEQQNNPPQEQLTTEQNIQPMKKEDLILKFNEAGTIIENLKEIISKCTDLEVIEVFEKVKHWYESMSRIIKNSSNF